MEEELLLFHFLNELSGMRGGEGKDLIEKAPSLVYDSRGRWVTTSSQGRAEKEKRDTGIFCTGTTQGCMGRQVTSSPLFGVRPSANHCRPRGPVEGEQGSSQAAVGGGSHGGCAWPPLDQGSRKCQVLLIIVPGARLSLTGNGVRKWAAPGPGALGPASTTHVASWFLGVSQFTTCKTRLGRPTGATFPLPALLEHS